MSDLTRFWSRIVDPVHPDDKRTFALYDPTASVLNRDFPPPAFVGDFDHAPVVILMGNGGYDPIKTPREFPDRHAVERYLAYLRLPGPIDPARISPYYAQHYAANLIRRGDAAIVNACAYRSSTAMNNGNRRQLKFIANLLPSVKVAREWAKGELMSAAAAGERLVVVHRPGLWELEPGDRHNFYQAVDPEWARKPLPMRFRDLIEKFLP